MLIITYNQAKNVSEQSPLNNEIPQPAHSFSEMLQAEGSYKPLRLKRLPIAR